MKMMLTRERVVWAFTGAIDACELMTAFNVLGMHVKKSEVEAMLSEVDADGSGEVGDSFHHFRGPKLISFYSTHLCHIGVTQLYCLHIHILCH
jgi:hypothetical protein